jgi:hypothetical protein
MMLDSSFIKTAGTIIIGKHQITDQQNSQNSHNRDGHSFIVKQSNFMTKIGSNKSSSEAKKSIGP